MLKTLLLLVLVVGVVLTCSVLAAERTPVAPGKVGRSAIIAQHGVVATSQPLAAQIGLDVLKKGGNAIDAAIAANAAIGLVEPMSCGIGGDLFAIIWDAKTQKLYGLDASGRAPFKANRQFFADRNHVDIPTTGPLSWSVPGCVDGWAAMHQRFGSVPLEQLLEPSIRYAEGGFPVSEVIAGSWASSATGLASHPDSAKTYLIDGKAPEVGQLFKNPYLGKTYREIAKNGRDAFYKGRIAQEIVAFSDKNGGLFSLKDFEAHKPNWIDPVSTTYRGHQVWQMPPPGQGIAVLQMLNVLEAYNLKNMGPTSPDWWHLFLEAKKLAYADRARHYADPAFAKVPTLDLISKPYADKRRALIDLQKAMPKTDPGDPKLGKADTIYLTVVDKDRNCVSLIQSNYFGFGSGLVPGDLGFALQNRGCLFALDPDHPNRLEPHKRPFHTIIPAFVTRDGKPFFVFGVMGGDMQPQGQVEVLVNLIDFEMNVQAAGDAPRLEHIGHPTPTGRPGNTEGGVVTAEPGISQEIVDELRKRGHNVLRTRKNGGGYQGILIDPKTGMLHGGSEYRKDGCAVGY